MVNKVEKIPAWLSESEGQNKGTLWQIVKAYRANLRQGTVGVKTRAMVRSTGKKPYKQKRTGNARRGSFVAHLHVGGGVAHGPVARSYRQALPTKMALQALSIALAERAKAGGLFEGALKVASGKSKDAATLLKSCLAPVGKTVVCLDKMDELTVRAMKNLRGLVLVKPEQLTALDVVEARSVVLTPGALKVIEARLKASE